MVDREAEWTCVKRESDPGPEGRPEWRPAAVHALVHETTRLRDTAPLLRYLQQNCASTRCEQPESDYDSAQAFAAASSQQRARRTFHNRNHYPGAESLVGHLQVPLEVNIGWTLERSVFLVTAVI
jgi:hypothetical protein